MIPDAGDACEKVARISADPIMQIAKVHCRFPSARPPAKWDPAWQDSRDFIDNQSVTKMKNDTSPIGR